MLRTYLAGRVISRLTSTFGLAAILVGLTLASGPYPFVFISTRGGSQEIWTAMSDGTGLRKLTQTGGGSPYSGKRIGTYALSPDGTKVVYGEPGAYVASLWIFDIVGGSFTQLTTDGVDSTIPSWSPDGSRIIYVRAYGYWEIFSRTPEVSLPDVFQHTNSSGVSTHASYSPDGQKITYDRGGNPARIYVQDATGVNQNMVDLTADIGGHSFHPAFSPDGAYIAFGHEGPFGIYNIWIMDCDGSNKRQVTNLLFSTRVTGRGLTWTPDGSEIFYAGFDGVGNENIFAVNPHTGDIRQVTFGAAYDTSPAFSQYYDPPNVPPIADAGMDFEVPCSSTSGTAVTLDGANSSDPNGDALTYTWTGSFGATTGVSPTVLLPIGTHEVTLTVTDGEFASSDTVEITISVGVEGFLPPVAQLVPESALLIPEPIHALKRGRTIPLKLRLSCGTVGLTDADVAPPQIVGVWRNGEAENLSIIDPDPGEANDDGLMFRFNDDKWVFNLSTAWAQTGKYVIAVRMPDGKVYKSGFQLK